MSPEEVIRRLGNGDLVPELVEALVVTANEVQETGKKGTVTVTFELLVQQVGDPMVIVRDSVKRTPPKRDPRGVLLFAVNGGLHARDPRQVEMDFRLVEPPAPEIREPGDGATTIREA